MPSEIVWMERVAAMYETQLVLRKRQYIFRGKVGDNCAASAA
jgi:hypothetical protein